MNDLEDRYLPTSKAAEYVGMAIDTLKRYRWQDTQPHLASGPPYAKRNGRYYYRQSDLDCWMNKRQDEEVA